MCSARARHGRSRAGISKGEKAAESQLQAATLWYGIRYSTLFCLSAASAPDCNERGKADENSCLVRNEAGFFFPVNGPA